MCQKYADSCMCSFHLHELFSLASLIIPALFWSFVHLACA